MEQESEWITRCDEKMVGKWKNKVIKAFESSAYAPCVLEVIQFRDWAHELPREGEYPREVAYGSGQALKYLREHCLPQFLTTA